MNKPTSARDEAEFINKYYGEWDNYRNKSAVRLVEKIEKALDTREQRGRAKGLREAAAFYAEHMNLDRTGIKLSGYYMAVSNTADRLESELNTEPGEGSK